MEKLYGEFVRCIIIHVICQINLSETKINPKASIFTKNRQDKLSTFLKSEENG